MGGVEAAFGEITLVLFATLAPSGVVASVLMCVPALSGRIHGKDHLAIDHFMGIPLVVSLVGLIASATHLGNPANALYVMLGVGRSPLLNEVFCGVVFLGLAGLYWLDSFSEKPRMGLRRAALVPFVLSGVAFVAAIAFAYDADTILTWHVAYVPAALFLNAFTAGPLLALLALRLARRSLSSPSPRRFECGLAALSTCSYLLSLAVYALQGLYLGGAENHMTSASEQVFFPAFIAMCAVLSLSGVVLAALTVKNEAGSATYRMAFASALALAGVFIMRFAFYMSHMTVGLGV